MECRCWELHDAGVCGRIYTCDTYLLILEVLGRQIQTRPRDGSNRLSCLLLVTSVYQNKEHASYAPIMRMCFLNLNSSIHELLNPPHQLHQPFMFSITDSLVNKQLPPHHYLILPRRIDIVFWAFTLKFL